MKGLNLQFEIEHVELTLADPSKVKEGHGRSRAFKGPRSKAEHGYGPLHADQDTSN